MRVDYRPCLGEGAWGEQTAKAWRWRAHETGRRHHSQILGSHRAEDFFSDLTLFKANPKLLSPVQWALVQRAMGEKPYFLAYANGKSAMRVSPDVLTSGVHGFRKRNGGRERSVFSEPGILHYPYGNFRRFRSRRETPDAEPLERVLEADWRPRPLFAITKLPIAPGDPDALRPLFERRVVLVDRRGRDALIAARVIEVIEQPARILHTP